MHARGRRGWFFFFVSRLKQEHRAGTAHRELTHGESRSHTPRGNEQPDIPATISLFPSFPSVPKRVLQSAVAIRRSCCSTSVNQARRRAFEACPALCKQALHRRERRQRSLWSGACSVNQTIDILFLRDILVARIIWGSGGARNPNSWLCQSTRAIYSCMAHNLRGKQRRSYLLPVGEGRAHPASEQREGKPL